MAAKWIKLRDGLCHQGGGFQIWAKVVPSLLLSLFLSFLPLSTLSFLLGQGWGSLGIGELGEMGRSNDLQILHSLPSVLKAPLPLLFPSVWWGHGAQGWEMSHIRPSARQSSRGYAE